MSRRYYTPPPVQGNIPAFLKKAYAIKYVRELIKWSWDEYETALQYLTGHASSRAIRFFINEYSAMRVLAESEAFREVLGYLNEQNWNQLSGRERVFIRRAHELFTALR
jgi:hypothetical protein